MRKRIIIGFTGQAGTGKDTAANHLVDYHGFVNRSHADPLKKGVAMLIGKPLEWLEARETKEAPLSRLGGKSYREILQIIGTEVFRDKCREDYWMNLFEEYLIEHPTQNVAVSSIRFENEAEQIRKLGGYIIHMQRPNNPFKPVNTGHASEQVLTVADGDYIIQAEDVSELIHQLKMIMGVINEQVASSSDNGDTSPQTS